MSGVFEGAKTFFQASLSQSKIRLRLFQIGFRLFLVSCTAMNFQELTSDAAKKFIQEHIDTPVEELLLRAKKFPLLNIPFLVAQIEGKNKAKKKLPSWYATEGIVYPIKLSMEQCSSELTAAYKSALVQGDILIDLTGGFGVDSLAFSRKMNRIVYVEQNKELAEIAEHNFTVLQKNNIEVRCANSEHFIAESKEAVDWIYLDPARRKGGSKVFRLADCEPDLLAIKELLFRRSKHILVKTSPLLDLDSAVKELGCVKEIHVLAVDNDCKELLFVLDQETTEPEIIAVNIRKETLQDEFRFTRKTEREATALLHTPMDYLYEPNAAILKAGAFKSIALKTGVYKLNTSSHLYTSGEFQPNFPGRSFKVLKTVKYSKKELMEEIPEGKANITVRNFPDSVELIRKKTGLKDGGSLYLFATRDLHDKPVILLTEKIN